VDKNSEGVVIMKKGLQRLGGVEGWIKPQIQIQKHFISEKSSTRFILPSTVQ
jgi:hypothetical protein